MKIKSWCKPPLKCSYSIPEIPKSYKIFGMQYPSKENSLTNIKEMVKESFKKYLELLETLDPKMIEEIESIHLKINEILNDNKHKEVSSKLNDIKNETIKKKNEILDYLKKKIM